MKNKTYLDKLMAGKDFRERFDNEYQNLCIEEQFAKACGADLKIVFVKRVGDICHLDTL